MKRGVAPGPVTPRASCVTLALLDYEPEAEDHCQTPHVSEPSWGAGSTNRSEIGQLEADELSALVAMPPVNKNFAIYCRW